MKTSDLWVYALLAGSVVIAACSQTTELSPLQYAPNAGSLRGAGHTPSNYRVLHSFGADRDGIDPNAGLLYDGGTFYGTTAGGGSHGKGTVFTVTSSGTENVVHSFDRAFKGRQPYAGLIDVGGTLYGTTPYGGAFGEGTVFSMSADGSERVLHSFGKGNDGYYPSATLLDIGGALYGTTSAGGANNCVGSDGCGTVFSITTSGKENLLFTFSEGPDGKSPDAGLIEVHGMLYSTTYKGGKYGAGTVFRVTTDGRERVLHNFGNGSDGANPASA